MATDMEKDLSKGEKVLGKLGGMFSMTWKPKKGRQNKALDHLNARINCLESEIPCINTRLSSNFLAKN